MAYNLIKLILLLVFPTIVFLSLTAAIQTRTLSRYLPSKAWTWKFRLMVFFMLANVFGILKAYFTVRTYNKLDPVYAFCVLFFLAGLNYFDYLLIRDYKNIRGRLRRASDVLDNDDEKQETLNG